MHPRCPRCDVAFEPEQGYFVGSMYLAYAFAVAIVGGLTLAGVHLWPEVRAHVVFAFAALAYLPLVPLVFRFSRLVWMTLDPVFRRE
jgi:membrane protein YdbS with pleckstrin-like domain